MEIQYHASEDIDFTKGDPVDEVTNLSFAFMFETAEIGKSFTDSWLVEVGDKKS